MFIREHINVTRQTCSLYDNPIDLVIVIVMVWVINIVLKMSSNNAIKQLLEECFRLYITAWGLKIKAVVQCRRLQETNNQTQHLYFVLGRSIRSPKHQKLQTTILIPNLHYISSSQGFAHPKVVECPVVRDDYVDWYYTKRDHATWPLSAPQQCTR